MEGAGASEGAKPQRARARGRGKASTEAVMDSHEAASAPKAPKAAASAPASAPKKERKKKAKNDAPAAPDAGAAGSGVVKAGSSLATSGSEAKPGKKKGDKKKKGSTDAIAAAAATAPQGAATKKGGTATKEAKRVARVADKKAAREAARTTDKRAARKLQRKAEQAREREREALRERELVKQERERALMQAEEERQRALDARLAQLNALRQEAVGRIAETLASAQRRQALRKGHSAKTLTELRSLKARKGMKSDVKKSTGIAKRVTTLTEETLPSLLKDIEGFNLSRYASEVAIALVGPHLKSGDVEPSVAVASALHQRYADFAPSLLQAVVTCLMTAVDTAGMGAPPTPVLPPGAAGGALDSLPPKERRAVIAANPVLGALESAKARIPPPPSDFGGGDFGGGGGRGGDDLAADFGGGSKAGGGSGAGAGSGGTGATIASTEADRDPKQAPGRVRLLLRLLIELHAAGIHGDTAGLTGVLLSLLSEAGAQAARDATKGSLLAAATASSAGAAGDSKPGGDAAPEGDSAPAPAATGPSKPFGAARPLGYAPRPDAIPDKVARRLVRELPLVVSLVKGAGGEDLLAVPSRRTRAWLTTLPAPLLTAWVSAHGGSTGGFDVGTYRDEIRGYEDASRLLRLEAEGGWELQAEGKTAPVAAAAAAPASGEGAPPSSSLSEPSPPLGPFLPSLALSPPDAALIRRGVDRYFDCVGKVLVSEHTALRRQEKAADLLLFQKGEVPERLTVALEAARAQYDRLLSGVSSLAECLDRDLPELPDLGEEAAAGGSTLTLWAGGSLGAGSFAPFDDAFTRSFYRDVPQLRDTVPLVLLDPDGSAGLLGAGAPAASGAAGGAPSGAAARPVAILREKDFVDPNRVKGSIDSALSFLKTPAPGGSAAAGKAAGPSAPGSDASGSSAVASSAPAAPGGGGGDVSSLLSGGDRDDDEDESGQFRPSAGVAALLAAASGADASAPSASASSDASAMATRFRVLLEGLPRCGSREQVDEWVTDYVMERHNTKANRARLLKAIATSPPVFSDALPYYGRVVATLEGAVKGFAAPLIELLADELRYLLKRRRSSHLDLKMRNARLLAELVKFLVAPPVTVFAAMAKCLEDWGNPDGVSVLCAIMGEWAGACRLITLQTV